MTIKCSAIVTPCLSLFVNAIKPTRSVRINKILRRMKNASGIQLLLFCLLIFPTNNHLANGLTCMVRLARPLESWLTSRVRDCRPKRMLLLLTASKTRKVLSNSSKRKRMMLHRRVRAVSHKNHSKRRRSQSIILEAPLAVTRSSMPSDNYPA